jgi:predicted secreted Zn-dependent protease
MMAPMKKLLIASIGLAACAGAPRGAKAPTPLTSVDTVFYEVAGSTPAQWRQQLPRAAQAAGIRNGGVTYTLAQMVVSPGYTRTTSIGCQFDGSLLQLRIGHVMPRLSASASPSADDRAAWDAFTGALWAHARMSEQVGQLIADSVRAEVRHERAQECAPLIEQTHQKLDGFGARYRTALAAAEASLGDQLRPVLP